MPFITCHQALVATVPRIHRGGVRRCQRRAQVFLDALGEPLDSVRRLGNRGIYEWQVLNGGTQFEVDLLLLDERYERVPLPCHTAARMCASGNSSISESRKVCPLPTQLPVHRVRVCGDVFTKSLLESQTCVASGVVSGLCGRRHHQ